MNDRSARWLRPAVIVVLAIYWTILVLATHWPKITPPDVSDKLLHAGAYATLAFLLAIGVSWRHPWSAKRYLLLFLLLAAVGGLDELTQPPFHRTADWYDWYADLAGIVAGLVVAGIVLGALNRRAQMRP